jgi:hypothetical protein
MRIKKFNKFNEGAESNIDLFYNEYKSLVDFNENDYEEGDEPSNADLLSEISDLTIKYNLSEDDVKNILDNMDISFDINNLLKIIYEDYFDEEESSDGRTNILLEIQSLIRKIKKKYPESDRDKPLITPKEFIEELEELELTQKFIEDGDF